VPLGSSFDPSGQNIYICDFNDGVRGFDATTNLPLVPPLITNGDTTQRIAFSPSTAPNPPSGLTGKVINNRFATQTDRINQLSWLASTTSTVTNYQLSRNGVVIATLKAGFPEYIYDDHNRRKGVPDTYSLIAIDKSGRASTAITLTLP
jgi:hypothetical protein